ncbi:kinesin-related protein 4 isoform X1 [Athalia rosae]|uniref:kinesin-related protein 4 isoform X1 n=3 Tax=Athalia rosae TaxID=37344 RepID=UPI0020336378|nr:kinesin-related protein 4 isoform X1 [Athalia rosae]
MSDSIKVAIKVRPLIKREREENLPIQWEVQENRIYSVDPETKRRGDYSYVFDHIFDTDTGNPQVYNTTVRPIVDAAVNGFNGTIFAYGQTSSGKTYTMMGTQDDPGIIPLAVENMFDSIANTTDREFLLRVSYLEIYNEKVNDLLHKDGIDLKIHEDCNGHVVVKCKEEVTNCPQNVLAIMKKGDKRRRIGETNMNERSSRSHTLFRITIESRDAKSDADGAIQVSQLNLVDLAGSERARQTGATGDRFKEGRHINLSLSALGLVIMQLSEAQEHVNFRDSKLTRILQASLGGNALTTIICAVTPAALDETHCTLAFASRAKSIKNKPQLNEVMSDAALLKRYSKQIAKLSAELEKARQVNRCAEVEEMETKLQEKERLNELLEDRMQLLKTRIVSGANSVENVDFKNKSRRRRTWGGPTIPCSLNHSLALPTIQEIDSTDDSRSNWKRSQVKKRQSIIQTPVDDIVNEGFQTQVEDFELELIESERNWETGRFSSESLDLEDNYYITKRKPSGNHVKFREDVSVLENSFSDSFVENSEPQTPPRRHEETDSGTPKEVLRERITQLADEYIQLREFTTLEKQLYTNEKIDAKDQDTMETLISHLKKSAADSEMMCLESNKKYSDLQDKYYDLEGKYNTALLENDVLKRQLESFTGIEERLKSIELEKSQLKKDMETKLQRLKNLEEERNDYEFKLELLESKHKTREKELETSLQIAWTEFKDPGDDKKLPHIIHLQTLVDSLTKEVQALKLKSECTEVTLDSDLSIENEMMTNKLSEYALLLKNAEKEKAKLLKKLKELRRCSDHKPILEHDMSLNDHKDIEVSNESQNRVTENTSVIDDVSEKVAQPIGDFTSMLHQSISNGDQTAILPIDSIPPKVENMMNETEIEPEFLTADFNQPAEPSFQTETAGDDMIPTSNEQITPLEVLQSQINEKSQTIAKLTDSLHVALDENNNIKSSLESFQSTIEQQKLEIINLKERVAALVTRELEVTSQYNDVVLKLREVSSDKDAVIDENTTLKSQLSLDCDQLTNNKTIIDSLQSDMDQLKLKLEEKNLEFLNMKAKVEELEQLRIRVDPCHQESTADNKFLEDLNLRQELEVTKTELNTRVKEIEDYKSTITNIMDEITKKSDEISTLNGLIVELNVKNEDLQLKFDSVSKELDRRTESILNMSNGMTCTQDVLGKKEVQTLVLVPPETNDLIQLKSEDSCTTKIQSSEKTPIKNSGGGEFDALNSSVKTDLLMIADDTISNIESSRAFPNLCNNDNNLVELVTQSEQFQDDQTSDKRKEDIDALKIEVDRLISTNEMLVNENAVLKSQTQALLVQIEESEILSQGVNHVEKDLVNSEAKICSLEKALADRDAILKESHVDIEKLEHQIIRMQNEHTLYMDEKCAMQKMIEENQLKLQQLPKLELDIEDLKHVNAEFERINLELRTNLNAKSLELESLEVHKYESEIRNLKSYIENLEHFNKNITEENDDLKSQLHNRSLNLENDLANLSQRIVEQEKVTRTLEQDKKNLMHRITELSTVKTEEIASPTSDLESKTESSVEKSPEDTADFSSIFTNASYFDEMDVQASTPEESPTNTTISANDTQMSSVTNLRKKMEELQHTNKRSELMNKDFSDKLSTGEVDIPNNENISKLHELINVKKLLEEENSKIATELRLKVQESDEIKNDVKGLRLGIERLEQTIHLLTTENMEMSSKLNMEKDRAKEAETSYQGQLEKLYSRISETTQEKVQLESELKICQELLDTLRANTPIGTENEVKEKIEKYQATIDSLTTENIELTTDLNIKQKELDEIKQSKALLYDHDCSYKEKAQQLAEKLEAVNQEYIELSDNLMETIEESDSLKHAYELLENKLTISVKNQLSTSINFSNTEITELKAQNSQLKSENLELVAKVASLSDENTKFADNLLETMAALDSSRLHHDRLSISDKSLDKSMHLSRWSDKSTPQGDDSTTEDNIETLKSKVEAYQQQVDQLTRLNKKLSDLKLSSCTQCTHLKELNDSRRTLKLEVRTLNHKLQDLQKKFEQKCADTEVLRNKACEELNLSIMSDMMLNGSISDSMNVTMVEEKVQSLNSELDTLKESHDKLSNLYREKCSEVDRFNESNAEESIFEAEPEIPSPKNYKVRIERVQNDIDKLRGEIQLLKKRNTSLAESLRKFMDEKSNLQTEIETLKASKESLNVKYKNSEMQIDLANEKASILESEVTDLNKLIESLKIIEREAMNDKLNFEVEIESLKTEKNNNRKVLEELTNSLKSEKENNTILQKSLEEMLEQIKVLKQDHFKSKYSSPLKKIEEPKISETNETDNVMKITMEDMERQLIRLSEENDSLHNQLKALDQKLVTDKSALSSDYKRLKDELDTAKEYITKEIRSLKPKRESSDSSNKTVHELLVDFLKIIMMKEQEIIKAVQDRFDQEKQSLEESKRQSVNAEKRISNWAKELENDIEKLQADLLHQEKRNDKLKHQIERLENDLKESHHEKQLLKEKFEVMETDFNGLQTEFTKRSEVDNNYDKEVNEKQERERLALASAMSREIELQNSMKSMKDQYNKKIEELTFSLDQHKTKNMELESNIEGFEANEKQLKSIIDVKSMDLIKLQQRTAVLETENVQISEMCSQLNQEDHNKSQRIEEITNLLKIKCDKLSEYKTKLESIIPEYEMLKEQIKERKQYVDKYKKEYEDLKEKSEKESNLIKDKLSDEEIKSSSLSVQLADLNKKNKVILSELEEMKNRCEELEKSNDKLLRKVRNSTSNSRVEAQIEDLKDQNAMLQKNAEGASNRITELQESKNLVTRDLVSLRGKYDSLLEEKNELEKIVGINRAKLSSSDEGYKKLQEKFQAELQEKNKIALELEATKLSITQKEKQLVTAQQDIERLRRENKELDEEMEELSAEIQERIATNTKLEAQLYEMMDNAKHTSNYSGDNAVVQNEKNDPEVEILIEQNKELRETSVTLTKTIDILKKENAELKVKITELESKRESRSCGSSRSSSPMLENNRRKQRRSDLYNQGRPLDEIHVSSDTTSTECRCSSLAQKVRELELDIVSKNGKIATLELQIQSQNFPYQKKCKELEENLWAFKNKNTILKADVIRLQRAISMTSITECEICRRRQTNKRDQSTQCLPEQKTFLSGTSSGILDDAAKIHKLEKEKALMRDLCRARTRQIRELQKQVSDYETILSEKYHAGGTTLDREKIKDIESVKSLTYRDKSQIFGENTKRAMKENLSSNILDSSMISSNRNRSKWRHYP